MSHKMSQIEVVIGGFVGSVTKTKGKINLLVQTNSYAVVPVVVWMGTVALTVEAGAVGFSVVAVQSQSGATTPVAQKTSQRGSFPSEDLNFLSRQSFVCFQVVSQSVFKSRPPGDNGLALICSRQTRFTAAKITTVGKVGILEQTKDFLLCNFNSFSVQGFFSK